MAKVNIGDVSKYEEAVRQNGNMFFGLGKDKETARIRVLANNFNDIDVFYVHTLELSDDKRRYVNCLRGDLENDPIDMCPFCAAKVYASFRVMLQFYKADEDAVKIWDRGKTEIQRFESLCLRYNPLVSTEFEIERQGKPGEQTTKYQFYPLETDKNVTLASLPQKLDLSNLILDKTAEEMIYAINFAKTHPAGKFEFPQTEEVSQTQAQNQAQGHRSIPVGQPSVIQTPQQAGFTAQTTVTPREVF